MFRNTLGDVQPPQYSHWLEQREAHPLLSTGVIIYTWILWYVEMFMMLIMLLNMLIAIVSNGYEEVVQNSKVTQYRFRCQFNFEATMIKEFF